MHANIQNPQLKYTTAAVEELKTLVAEKLQQRFTDGLVSSTIDYDFPVFVVKREIIADVIEYLYNDAHLSFQFLTTLASSQPSSSYLSLGRGASHCSSLVERVSVRQHCGPAGPAGH